MTIHDKIAEAVKRFVGKTLSTKQVQALVLEKYPGTNPTSIIPGDHSGPNPRSRRSYCHCSGKISQIFTHDNGGYRVMEGAVLVPGWAASSGIRSGSIPIKANEVAHVRTAQKATVIDEAFISEWHPKYDCTENDEPEYQRLVGAVAGDMASAGSITKDTFVAIWRWKGAMRVIRHVSIEEYETLYAPAFCCAASESPGRKLAVLLAPPTKLPGIEAATGSTILHFMHPETMPIIDVRTIEVLFDARLISTDQKDLAHYEEFRQAIEAIKRRCQGRTLRHIDRALFAYHKQFLEPLRAKQRRVPSTT